jgi:hypothetical protein
MVVVDILEYFVVQLLWLLLAVAVADLGLLLVAHFLIILP